MKSRINIPLKYVIVFNLILVLVACGPSEQINDSTSKFQRFKDDKIESTFPELPEMLPIEDVFFGNGTGIKRTYLSEQNDSLMYLVCNITISGYNEDDIKAAITEFKESYMISEIQPLDIGVVNDSVYQAYSELSGFYYFVKFGRGATLYDVYYATCGHNGSYPDSVTAFYFLEHSIGSH